MLFRSEIKEVLVKQELALVNQAPVLTSIRKIDFQLRSKGFDFDQPKESQEQVGLGQQEQEMLQASNKVKETRIK